MLHSGVLVALGVCDYHSKGLKLFPHLQINIPKTPIIENIMAIPRIPLLGIRVYWCGS